MFSSSSISNSSARCGGGDSAERTFDPVLVYCRIRPLPTPVDINNVVIKNPTTVALISNSSTTGTNHSKQPNSDYETHYVFKQVFGPETAQNEVYRVVAEPLVENLIRGNSSLLFTYGVTGSGKTYTMTGDAKELGLMPRCLEALFRSISGLHARRCTFQPDHLNSFEILSDMEAQTRQKKLQRTTGSTSHKTLRPKSAECEFDLSSLNGIPPLSGVDERSVYAVFISYTEVYNNCVYDLLEEGSIQKTLQNRIVREDANHNMYVHGVVEMEIKSVQEAMDAYQIGQKRKRIAHTVLNAESSRSHSVFNVRLVQAPIGQHSRADKGIISVSQLSLVDLAGSERSARTKNTGARLREAGNINNSLMTLRTCLEYLRENQQAPMGTVPKKIPYRDSKITQLFKNFFEGEGQVSMIACINPSLEDSIENSQVMKFAEITQELQVARSTTIHLTNDNNDILKLLSLKFGCQVEGPIGDGPLSEQLINFFEQQLKKDRDLLTKMEQLYKYEVKKYRHKISELEDENGELNVELNELRILYQKACEKNHLMEDIHKTSINELEEKLKDQNERLNFLEQRGKRFNHRKGHRAYMEPNAIAENPQSALRRVKSLCDLNQAQILSSNGNRKKLRRSRSVDNKSSSPIKPLFKNQETNTETKQLKRVASKTMSLINFQLLKNFIDLERRQT